jgi:pyruvate dehydrogenase E1 component alpha subunit
MQETLRIIGDGKEVADESIPEGLSEKDLIELFRWMVLLRTFDERAVALQRQGRIGTYAMYWGEEATQAGPLYALEDADWVFPSYRQNSIAILRGVSPAVILSWWRGYGGVHGFYNTREHRVGPICVPIATHLPHSVGVAWAAKIKGEKTASLAWFGDGATSEGDFHEAMNFSGVLSTAAIFFCVNNQWAISTPLSKQTATETLVEKAAAYGMPGTRVDGFDPLACYQATREAVTRAKEGEGPSLIEAFCYRIGPHGTADDPRLYRDESETDRWRPLEPISRMSGYLERNQILDTEQVADIHSEAKERMKEAVYEMESIEHPSQEILFDYVYASGRPASFDEALEELRSIERPPAVKPIGPQPGAQTGDVEVGT